MLTSRLAMPGGGLTGCVHGCCVALHATSFSCRRFLPENSQRFLLNFGRRKRKTGASILFWPFLPTAGSRPSACETSVDVQPSVVHPNQGARNQRHRGERLSPHYGERYPRRRG
jgi:hypothetical protein